MSKKEGIDGALDFTKFTIALASALIAFVTGATFVQSIDNWWEKTVAICAIGSLVISVVGGIAVYMEAATMLSKGEYDLSKAWIKIPGQINVIMLAIGAAAIGLLAIFKLFYDQPVDKPEKSVFAIECSKRVDHKNSKLFKCTVSTAVEHSEVE
jgi:hypothetical protein